METQEDIKSARKHELMIEKLKTERMVNATYNLRRGARSLVKWSVVGGVAGLVCHKMGNREDTPEAEEI